MIPQDQGLSAGMVEVRALRASDIALVQAIAAASPEAPQWPRQSYLEIIATDSQSQFRRIALAVVSDSKVRGFAIANFLKSEKWSELEIIVVHPQARNQGLGGRLLGAVMSTLSEQGAQRLRLEVRASNKNAIRFYRAWGFQISGRRHAYYHFPSEDALLFECGLGS